MLLSQSVIELVQSFVETGGGSTLEEVLATDGISTQQLVDMLAGLGSVGGFDKARFDVTGDGAITTAELLIFLGSFNVAYPLVEDPKYTVSI
jgi:hypothetical protein